jgi:hypothetical protein
VAGRQGRAGAEEHTQLAFLAACASLLQRVQRVHRYCSVYIVYIVIAACTASIAASTALTGGPEKAGSLLGGWGAGEHLDVFGEVVQAGVELEDEDEALRPGLQARDAQRLECITASRSHNTGRVRAVYGPVCD